MDNNTALVLEYQSTGDISTRNRAVLGVKSVVYSVATKYLTRSNYWDLISEGIIAVIKACETYKHGRGASYITYAKACATYAMVDYIRVDKTIPSGSASMHCSNLSNHALPQSHSEIKALAEKTGVLYDTALQYAYTGTVSLHNIDKAGSDITLKSAETCEVLEIVNSVINSLSKRDCDIINSVVLETSSISDLARKYGISRQRVDGVIDACRKKLLYLK